MHFRPLLVKKKKSDFSDFADFLTIFLILGFSPLFKTPDSPRVPYCHFILKIGKKQISDADP